MTLSTLLIAANIAYGYSDEDKSIIRQMALDDKQGLLTALQTDPLLPWIAYNNGLIDEPPKGS